MPPLLSILRFLCLLPPTASSLLNHLSHNALSTFRSHSQGVDAIYCAASNDCFVTSAWAKSLNAGEKMTILADGDCAFAKLMGLTVETEGFGGLRLSRFSALIEDGVVTKLHLEEGGGYSGASGADQMLKDLE